MIAMAYKPLFILLVVFLIGAGLLFYGAFFFRKDRTWDEGVVTVRGNEFDVFIADTAALRAQGLSGRESLRGDEGMFFIFDSPARQSFWMRDMKFPIDIVWISGERVVDISKNVPIPAPGTSLFSLPTYSPKEPIDRVLEVNAGMADRLGIQAGDVVHFSPKRMAGVL